MHHIKIDQTFIRDLETDREDAAIVTAVINLGQSMGLEVTAEGVETAGQAATAESHGLRSGAGLLLRQADDRNEGAVASGKLACASS